MYLVDARGITLGLIEPESIGVGLGLDVGAVEPLDLLGGQCRNDLQIQDAFDLGGPERVV